MNRKKRVTENSHKFFLMTDPAMQEHAIHTTGTHSQGRYLCFFWGGLDPTAALTIMDCGKAQ